MAPRPRAQRIEAEFHAGWIALRFLDDAGSRRDAFRARQRRSPRRRSRSRAPPIGRAAPPRRSASRGGRAALLRARRRPADHLLRPARAREARPGRPALRRPTLGRGRPRRLRACAGPGGRAALRHRRAATSRSALYADLAQRSTDPASSTRSAASAARARRPRPARRRQAAVQRGFPLDTARLSDVRHSRLRAGRRRGRAGDGLRHRPPGERLRPEGASRSAGARGLMQLMPATAKRTAKRFGVAFDVEAPRPTTRPTTPRSARPISAS